MPIYGSGDYLTLQKLQITLTFDSVDRFQHILPFFHKKFDFQQFWINEVLKIPLDGGFGDFWWLFWLFSQKATIQMTWFLLF